MKQKLNRRKYFTGNKKLKNIKMFEEFDDELENEYAEDGEEAPYWEIELKDGKTLVVDVQSGEGMAGEPMEMVFLKVGKDIVHYKDVKDKIKDPEQAKELRNYLDDVSAGNDASARSWAE